MSAEPKHLFEEFQKVSNKSKIPLPKEVDWLGFGDSWTTQAGLPLVRVSRNYQNGEVTLTQGRFCSGEGADQCKEGQWWIPIKWTFQGDKEPQRNPIVWLHGDKNIETVNFNPGVGSDQWILANFKSVGKLMG